MLLKTNLESAIFMVVLAVKNKKDGLLTVFPCDPRGIQTHNLLIRSQMLYSVELGDLPFGLRVQRYGHFCIPPNFSAIIFRKNAIFLVFCLFGCFFAPQ